MALEPTVLPVYQWYRCNREQPQFIWLFCMLLSVTLTEDAGDGQACSGLGIGRGWGRWYPILLIHFESDWVWCPWPLGVFLKGAFLPSTRNWCLRKKAFLFVHSLYSWKREHSVTALTDALKGKLAYKYVWQVVSCFFYFHFLYVPKTNKSIQR